MVKSIMYKISSFEYMPGINGPSDDFVTYLKEIKDGNDLTGIYTIDVPDQIRRVISSFPLNPNPEIVFLPVLLHVHDLDSIPQECGGGIAVKIKNSTVFGHNFATVIRCSASPVV